MTKIIQYPVIDKGIVEAKGVGTRFVYRSFINMPLGWAYLYPVEKNEHFVKMEMELLNAEDRNIPVFFPAAGRAFPVYWDEDGMPEMAVAEINVFTGLITGDMILVDLDEDFAEDHLLLMQVYRRHFDDNEFNKLMGNVKKT